MEKETKKMIREYGLNDLEKEMKKREEMLKVMDEEIK